jgi:hypothetical protein
MRRLALACLEQHASRRSFAIEALHLNAIYQMFVSIDIQVSNGVIAEEA